MSINLTTTLAPSGSFCAMPQVQTLGSFGPEAVGAENYLIYNPGVQDIIEALTPTSKLMQIRRHG